MNYRGRKYEFSSADFVADMTNNEQKSVLHSRRILCICMYISKGPTIMAANLQRQAVPGFKMKSF